MVQQPLPPVADEEETDLSPGELEQIERFPEKPCRFLRVYLYASLLVPYINFHC